VPPADSPFEQGLQQRDQEKGLREGVASHGNFDYALLLEQLAKELNPFASDQPSAVSFLFLLKAESSLRRGSIIMQIAVVARLLPRSGVGSLSR
jgi:hypothetical protein